MTSNTVHDGGCLCGEVRFQAIGEPEVAAVCHCRYCQLRTGSAFGISIYLKSENLKISSARLKSYTFTSESGKVLTYKFCDNCGTTLFWDVELFPGLIGTAGGSYHKPSVRRKTGVGGFLKDKIKQMRKPELRSQQKKASQARPQ